MASLFYPPCGYPPPLQKTANLRPGISPGRVFPAAEIPSARLSSEKPFQFVITHLSVLLHRRAVPVTNGKTDIQFLRIAADHLHRIRSVHQFDLIPILYCRARLQLCDNIGIRFDKRSFRTIRSICAAVGNDDKKFLIALFTEYIEMKAIFFPAVQTVPARRRTPQALRPDQIPAWRSAARHSSTVAVCSPQMRPVKTRPPPRSPPFSFLSYFPSFILFFRNSAECSFPKCPPHNAGDREIVHRYALPTPRRLSFFPFSLLPSPYCINCIVSWKSRFVNRFLKNK